ncbi:MAG: GDP-mannose 4,6-dehydratase [candidate division KSB1 bacterium]|nr:GDP-mannose 4,6-dehydratase [candidate division KSB1 bacterium]MDZ7276009.1 GDP-mannose 4,6-dehydratase [candidate division KSB1 bacterium]MDZ7285709.1 GDP-mannose 4,6-dehydratase [candidate division KSB1 bacterium]MDZ7298741.1 GDP-mannose 4,6-dehydratase [candidate division KSB1 bacterium]MDZ7349606.1 GDP-mannose 4,6-dehydratase [candidate division KSB1 bacterium]
MKCLLTGGAGFIGSHLSERLLARGHALVNLDNFNDYYDPAIKRRNIAPLLSHPAYTLFEGDILERDTLERLFREHRFDIIIHLAARAGVRPSIAQPLLYEKVNMEGTLNLLEMARQAGVPKFIFGSSSSVYGENGKVPFSESDTVDYPISPYAATKKAGEQICYTYHHLYQLKVTCLRFFTVYGPRQRPDMAIHKFTRLIANDERVPVYGDGSSRRDYTFISDIVDGIEAAIAHCTSYHIYNLGESRTIDLLSLIGLIQEYLGKRAVIEHLPPQPGDVPITYADISKARREIGYAPRVDIQEGVRQFVEWYRQNHPVQK